MKEKGNGPQEQNAGVGLEDLLRAVPVVDVPVQNGDALHSQHLARVFRRHRHVIEQAKPHHLRGGTDKKVAGTEADEEQEVEGNTR